MLVAATSPASERDGLIGCLDYQREALITKLTGVSDENASEPDGKLTVAAELGEALGDLAATVVPRHRGRTQLARRDHRREPRACGAESPPVIQIRSLEVGQSGGLVELFEQVLPGFGSTLSVDRAGPTAFLRDPASFVLGAYADGSPAGLAWGLQMRSPSGRLTTYLHELDVREEWRRQGIATALVVEAMAVARRNGSTRFWLSTGGHNETAQALYDSLGGDRKPLGDVNYWWNLD